MDYRLGPSARATKDLDLARQEDEQAATADLRTAQSLDLGDYFTFKIDRTGALDELLEGAAIRYRVQADLAGRPFGIVTVDVGFAEWLDLPHERIKGPAYFDFAWIQPVEVLALPLEQHIAEKLHAYVRIYADNRRSSRVKDLVDLVLISSNAEFEAGQFRHAINRTFDSRNTQSIPEFFPEPPERRIAPYRKLASEIGLDPNVAVEHKSSAAFLDPILSGNVPLEARWDPKEAVWKPPDNTTRSG